MRLFVALDINDVVRDRIARFLDGVQGFAPDARWVRPESLHVTLKFIGEKPEEELEQIRRALETIEASSFEMSFRGYGFFPGARAPRVFWVGIEGGSKLTSLAGTVDETLAGIDVSKEEHPFTPHLTLARGRVAQARLAQARRDNQRMIIRIAAFSICRESWQPCPRRSLVR
jgi:RNA 2',3'-cyclic 3'-phosphodiesterase